MRHRGSRACCAVRMLGNVTGDYFTWVSSGSGGVGDGPRRGAGSREPGRRRDRTPQALPMRPCLCHSGPQYRTTWKQMGILWTKYKKHVMVRYCSVMRRAGRPYPGKPGGQPARSAGVGWAPSWATANRRSRRFTSTRARGLRGQPKWRDAPLIRRRAPCVGTNFLGPSGFRSGGAPLMFHRSSRALNALRAF